MPQQTAERDKCMHYPDHAKMIIKGKCYTTEWKKLALMDLLEVSHISQCRFIKFPSANGEP